ncbi:MAG: acetylhydrolase [Chthoniobacteraceae bacterium]|nr:acetylhydrolase [Chthoniobacteraceae bacterium]
MNVLCRSILLLACSVAATLADDLVNSAIVPVAQGGMEQRHAAKVELVKNHKFDLLLIGDSITHNLDNPGYKAVWDQFFAPRNAIDLGYSGGRTENTLWNLANGELEGQTPKVAIVLIGTNNSDDANYRVVHTPEQIAEGTAAIVKLLREKTPATRILLLRIFPRTNIYKNPDGSERGSEEKRFATNLRAGELVARLADGKNVVYLDVNHAFLLPDGTLDPKLMPDRLHPSPEGALRWARAMEPTLAELFGDSLREAAAANNAVVPVSKLEQDGYDWFARHETILKQQDDAEIVLIGDSITHFWGGNPAANRVNGPQAFEATFAGKRVLNLGFGWDRTQNVLWRLDHGEMEKLHPATVVINIGTNNFAGTKNARANSPAEIVEGIREIVLRVRSKAPRAKVILMAVFPRGENAADPMRAKVGELNGLLGREFANLPGITFLDLNAKLTQPDGSISREVMSDFLHPSERGYLIWGNALKEAGL